MSNRDIGQEILDGFREIKAFKTDQDNLRTHILIDTASPQVIRAKYKFIPISFCLLDGS